MTRLCKTATDLASLHLLSLVHCQLGPDAAEALSSLILSNRCIGCTAQLSRCLYLLQLGKMSCFWSIKNFTKTRFYSPSFDHAYSKSLKELSLRNNFLGEEGAARIATCLKANKAITFLDLSGNQQEEAQTPHSCFKRLATTSISLLFVVFTPKRYAIYLISQSKLTTGCAC